MRFILRDSKHNILHWLAVTLSRVIACVFYMPLSAYLGAFGFLLSADTLQPHLPKNWFDIIVFYSAKLPYFSLIKEFIFLELNHWYKGAPVWWTMVVGLPLIVMAVSLFFIVFFNFYYSLFSKKYNHTHCPFCKEPIKVEE